MKSYKALSQILTEADVKYRVPYVLHFHNDPRNTSPHYDIRILDPYKKDELMSFAVPKEYDCEKKVPDKLLLFRTRPHPTHWLTADTYRIKKLEEGEAKVLVSSPKFFELEFMGKKLRGKYKLFKKSKTRRDDVWVMVKSK